MPFRLLAFLVFATIIARLPAQSDVTFTQGPALPATQLFAEGLAVADVLGSPLPDLVLSDLVGEIVIFRNLGGGTYAAPIFIQTLGASATKIAVADLDGDGDQDIVAALDSFLTVVLLRNANGWSSTYYGGVPAGLENSLRVIDIDTDGDLDIVQNGVTLVGDGTGAFPLTIGGALLDAAVIDRDFADFDLDGDLDEAELVLTDGLARARVRRNNGPFDFGAPIVIGAFDANIGAIHAADFTGDGRPDVAVSVGSGFALQIGARRVQVFAGTVSGDFIPKAPLLPAGLGASGDVVADFDQDGDLDIVQASSTTSVLVAPGALAVARNRGDGVFEAGGSSTFSALSVPRGIGAAGDVDGDGDTDMLMLNDIGAFGFSASVYSPSLSPATAAPVRNIAIVSGDAQIAAPGTAFAQPLAVLVTDALGVPLVGVPVTFFESTAGGGVILASSPAAVTNAQGIASIALTATTNSGPTTIDAFASIGQSVSFSLTVDFPQQIQKIVGDGQATDAGEPFLDPLIVQVVDQNGAALVGYPVTFSTQFPNYASFVEAQPVLTNAQGRASVRVIPGQTGGAFNVLANAGSATGTFSLFNRRMTISGNAASRNLVVTYRHEHDNQPLVLALDAPQAAPIASRYGTIFTSIFMPDAALTVFDPFGAYGLPDPTLFANPTFVRVYNYPPSLSGLNVVIQIYGFDPFYYPDLSQSIFVSNAVNRTL